MLCLIFELSHGFGGIEVVVVIKTLTGTKLRSILSRDACKWMVRHLYALYDEAIGRKLVLHFFSFRDVWSQIWLKVERNSEERGDLLRYTFIMTYERP